jgi:hypothetical protein
VDAAAVGVVGVVLVDDLRNTPGGELVALNPERSTELVRAVIDSSSPTTRHHTLASV